MFLNRCLPTPVRAVALYSLSMVLPLAAYAQERHPFAKYDNQAREILAKMTLDEKLGQMLQPDQQFLESVGDIDKYHLGSLLSGGDSDPKAGNSLQAWTDLYDGYQAIAMKTRLRIPLLYGIDSVHGNNNVEGATIFPHNIGLGCTRDAALVERISKIVANEIRATGIQWAFAPCVTVPRDIRWGRTYEGFGETPEIVTPLGEAATRGLQGANIADATSVLGCAKHFAGDGGTQYGTGLKKLMDHGDVIADEATFRKLFLPAYVASIRAGVGSMMPSYSSWNAVRCSANRHLLTEILKDELGFEGFLISDYNAIDEIPGDFQTKVMTSVLAGMDMFMQPKNYALFFNALKELVQQKKVPMSRIEDAVLRILRVKIAMGMVDPSFKPAADRSLWKDFGSPEHRAVARQAVRESLVVLKNDNQILPLKPAVKRIHLSGKNADDIGNQCGGWTVTWQGRSDNVVPGGATIRQALTKAVSPATVIDYTRDGSGAEGADVGILVIGEKPYAEMFGDRTIQQLSLDDEDKAALANMKKAGIPVVVVLISGRPLFVDDVIDQAGAWVAAWLPGSEGAGVTDVLFGSAKPTGKLSFTWPKSTSTSLRIGDKGYVTMFPLGYGLSY